LRRTACSRVVSAATATASRTGATASMPAGDYWHYGHSLSAPFIGMIVSYPLLALAIAGAIVRSISTVVSIHRAPSSCSQRSHRMPMPANACQ
jgi:hypothetical protein